MSIDVNKPYAHRHQHGAADILYCSELGNESAEGISVSGHPQHRVGDSFDCYTERYEIGVY